MDLHILSWHIEESTRVRDNVARAPPQRWPVYAHERQRSPVATCHVEPAPGPLAAVAVHNPIPHTCDSVFVVLIRIQRGCSCCGGRCICCSGCSSGCSGCRCTGSCSGCICSCSSRCCAGCCSCSCCWWW